MIVPALFGPCAPLVEVECIGRLRSLRALSAVYVGFDHPLSALLREAEHDDAALSETLAALNDLSVLRRRRSLSAYATLPRPDPKRNDVKKRRVGKAALGGAQIKICQPFRSHRVRP